MPGPDEQAERLTRALSNPDHHLGRALTARADQSILRVRLSRFGQSTVFCMRCNRPLPEEQTWRRHRREGGAVEPGMFTVRRRFDRVSVAHRVEQVAAICHGEVAILEVPNAWLARWPWSSDVVIAVPFSLPPGVIFRAEDALLVELDRADLAEGTREDPDPEQAVLGVVAPGEIRTAPGVAGRSREHPDARAMERFMQEAAVQQAHEQAWHRQEAAVQQVHEQARQRLIHDLGQQLYQQQMVPPRYPVMPVGGGGALAEPLAPPEVLEARRKVEDRAYALLQEVIGKAGAAAVRNGGAYLVKSKLWPDIYYGIPRDGRILILERGTVKNAVRNESCLQAVAPDQPWPDHVLAKIKAIQADETIVYATGIVTPPGMPPAIAPVPHAFPGGQYAQPVPGGGGLGEAIGRIAAQWTEVLGGAGGVR